MKLPHIHRFHVQHDTMVHRYYECRCGKRIVRRTTANFHQPIARAWLAGGEWNDDLGPPPPPTIPHKEHQSMNNDPNETWFNFEEIEIDGVKHLVIVASTAGHDPRYYSVQQFFPSPSIKAQLDGAIVEPE